MDSDLAKLKRSPQDVARWQKAQQHVVGGRPALALAAYRDLLKRYPGVDQLWFEQGIAAAGDLDFAFANQSLQRAAKLAPKNVELLVLIAQQYHRLHRPDQARDCFQRAVAADPGSVHAQLSLAAWLERERKLDDAQKCVEACLAQRPRDAQARYFHAFLLHRQGRNAEAETALRDLISSGVADPSVKYSSRHLLGVVLDALGQYPEAVGSIGEARTLLRQMTNVAALEQQYDEADRRRRELLAALTPATLQRWHAEGPAAPRPFKLAFLGGHPRSGTTLLEQILGAHPDVMPFDEPEAFAQEVLNPLAPMPPAKALTLDELNALTPARRLDMNNRYLKSLLREVEGEPAARVLLDKNPSPTSSLHLWLRVFPDLKVIIPLRDPRDVVVSCYFQNLALTPTNANFLSLERAAKHYADLMDVWLRLRELGGFDWLEARYEDVVDNPETAGRRLTEFLGLEWHASQATFQESAKRRVLFAPTYDDVTKPVHKRAIGRWENYANALAPVQEKLARYCKAFGYGS